jgi:hypothetical protein
VDFVASFGFAPDHTLSGWIILNNAGDEVVLRDAEGQMQDALVYEAGNMNIDGWDGIAVQPYGGSNFAKAGQILYRVLDEETGLAFNDTDTAADWAQHTDDPWHGQRTRYPGWDLEQFFQPALGATGTVTVGIAPDNAYQVVVDAIRSAEESIELELYTLEHYELVTELVQKAQRASVSPCCWRAGLSVGWRTKSCGPASSCTTPAMACATLWSMRATLISMIGTAFYTPNL